MTEASAYVASTLTPSLGLKISADTLSVRLGSDWEAKVRRFLLWGAGLSCAAAVMFTLASPADARSCSERLKICAKTEGGSPGCLAKCGEYRQSCLASGCWESKYVSKECGFARQ
jgi:hypothetical protein